MDLHKHSEKSAAVPMSRIKDRLAKLQRYTVELLRVTKLDVPIIGDIDVKEEDWSTHNLLAPDFTSMPFIQMEHTFIPSASINHGCDVLVFGVTKRKTIEGVYWDMPAVMVLTCACHGMDPETGYWDEDWHVRGVFTSPAAAVTSVVTRLVEDVVQNNHSYPLEGSDL